MLTKEQILKADQLASETVEIPEWDGAVAVRALNASERMAMVDGFYTASQANGEEAFHLHLLAASVCDSEGKPLMSPAEWGARNGEVTERLVLVAKRINGYGAAQKKS